jgi:glycosyltransferase involved in cell wall biosynthesis
LLASGAYAMLEGAGEAKLCAMPAKWFVKINIRNIVQKCFGDLLSLEKPKVSVIVPVYNVENYLNRCIDSILSQTFTEFECILVDDCSTDRSQKICDEYSRKDHRVKVIHNINNLGSSISRKVGFCNCDGEYIQYIDGDDWIEKNMLEKIWTKAASGGFAMVVCDYLYEKPGNVIYERQEIDKMAKIEIIKDIAVKKKLACAIWNKMVRRDVLLKIQFPTQNYSEDRFITLQAIYYSERIGYIEEALYHYRYYTNNQEVNVLY